MINCDTRKKRAEAIENEKKSVAGVSDWVERILPWCMSST